MKKRGKMKKKLKEMRMTSETSGTMLNAPTFESWGPRRRRQKKKKKTMRKYLRNNI